MRTRKRGRPCAAYILAIVTMASILAAPLCAPLCAATMCAPVRQGQCHEMAGADARHAALASTKLCGRLELSAVLASDDGRLWSAQRLRNLPSGWATTIGLDSIAQGPDAPRAERRNTEGAPLAHRKARLESTVLRI